MRNLLITILIIFIGIEIAAAKCYCERINITQVYDGDTVKGIINGKDATIRLVGIDCYETSAINRAYKQAYQNCITIEEVVKRGKESKKNLKNFIKNNPNIIVKITGKDCYNRYLGILYAGDLNINEYMIRNGGCLRYTYKTKNQ